MYLLIHVYVLAMVIASPVYCLPSPHIKDSTKRAGGRRPPALFVEAAEGRLLYMWTGEAINIAKTYTRINKYALDIKIYAYTSNILNILQHCSPVTSLVI